MIHTKIRVVLKMNYTDYDNYRHICFENWCVNQARKRGLCQRLLIKHDGLYNWYLDQWNFLVEKLFYEDNRYYIESGIEHFEAYWELFHEYPRTIEAYFPGVLLSMIKKQHKPANHELN